MNKLFKITMGAAILAMFACSDDSSSDTFGGGSWEDPNTMASDSGNAKDDSLKAPHAVEPDTMSNGTSVSPERLSPGAYASSDLYTISSSMVKPFSVKPAIKEILPEEPLGGGNVFEFEEFLGAYSVCKTNGIDEMRVFKVDSVSSKFYTYIATYFWSEDGAELMESDYEAFRKDCKENGGTLDVRTASDYDDLLWCTFGFDDKTDLKKVWRDYADEFYDQCEELSKDFEEVPAEPMPEIQCSTVCEETDLGEECTMSCPVLSF